MVVLASIGNTRRIEWVMRDIPPLDWRIATDVKGVLEKH